MSPWLEVKTRARCSTILPVLIKSPITKGGQLKLPRFTGFSLNKLNYLNYLQVNSFIHSFVCSCLPSRSHQLPVRMPELLISAAVGEFIADSTLNFLLRLLLSMFLRLCWRTTTTTTAATAATTQTPAYL